MKKIKFTQLLAINAVTCGIFILAIIVYALFDFIPFVGVCLAGLFYAIFANGTVLLGSDGNSIETRWKECFPREIEMLNQASLSITSREDFFNSTNDTALRKAYHETRQRVEKNTRAALDFLNSYDFVNRPDDHGRLLGYAREAERAVTDLNEFIDDSFDADGGAGDELDSYIRRISAMKNEIGGELLTKLEIAIDSLEKVSRLLHKRPELASRFRKLFTYYVPTLESLLVKYSGFVSGGVRGTNVDAAMADVQSVIEELPPAIEKMTDGVYEMDAMDIHSKKNVMEQFLERDGLKTK